MQKYLNKSRKGFTLIELIVVMAIIGILVLLAAPRFLSYTNEAKLTQIKNDVKAVEGVVTAYMAIHNNDMPEGGTKTDSDTLETAVADGKLYNTKGKVVSTNDIEGSGFEFLDKANVVVKETKTKLDGDFVANSDGRVYYIHSRAIKIQEPKDEDDGEEVDNLDSKGCPVDGFTPKDIADYYDANTGIGTVEDMIGMGSETAVFEKNVETYLYIKMIIPGGDSLTIFARLEDIPETLIAIEQDGILTIDEDKYFVSIETAPLLKESGLLQIPKYMPVYDENGVIEDCSKVYKNDDDNFTELKPIENPGDIYLDIENKGVAPGPGKIINAYTDPSDPSGEWVYLYEFDDATAYVTKYVGYYNTKTKEILQNSLSLFVPSHVRKVEGYEYVDTGRDVLGVAADAFNGEYADNKKMVSIHLPKTIKVIKERGLANNELTEIVLPTHLEVIGESAFENNRLGSIQNSVNLKTIGTNAFRYNNIGSLVINNLAKQVEIIGDYAFADNQWLGEGTISFLTIGGKTYVDNFKGRTKIDINGNIVDINGVKLDKVESVSMGEGVFLNSTKNMTDEGRFTVIGDFAFALTAGNIQINHREIYVENPNTIFAYFGESETLNIPNNFVIDGETFPVEHVGMGAFNHYAFKNWTWEGAKEIVIGSNIKSIGDEAFYSSTHFDSVIIKGVDYTDLVWFGNGDIKNAEGYKLTTVEGIQMGDDVFYFTK